MIVHIRMPSKPIRGRAFYSAAHFARVSGVSVQASTLCGAATTAYDIQLSWVRKTTDIDLDGRVLCPLCIEKRR